MEHYNIETFKVDNEKILREMKATRIEGVDGEDERLDSSYQPTLKIENKHDKQI